MIPMQTYASSSSSLQTLKKFLGVYQLTYKGVMESHRLDKRGLLSRKRLETMKQEWAADLLKIFGVDYKICGTPCTDRPVLLVGNHLSYLDIPLLMAVAPTVFVAKSELAKWPAIGAGCRRIGIVFVERRSVKSRSQASAAIADKILDQNQSVTVFPSGTTCLEMEKPWRKGAFSIAQQFDLDVQPFRIWYEPARECAYIDNDMFATHLWRLLGKGQIQCRIEFAEPTKITNPIEDAEMWRQWSVDPDFRYPLETRPSRVPQRIDLPMKDQIASAKVIDMAGRLVKSGS